MHICSDEIVAFLSIFPFVGAAFVWVRTLLRGRTTKEGLND